MWSKKSKPSTKARPKSGAADTLITMDTKITGDVCFSGVLFVDGHIKGDVSSSEGNHSLLTIGANGHIEGEIKVPQVVIYGYVKGDVHTSEHLNLQKDSRIEGNVYYNLLEMAMGASVNGELVKKDIARKLLNHNPDDNNKVDEEVDELQSTLDGS
jgi:cytoskeletal protein CcmA (bactofilin family)